jgi:branched-chain amino acid transport system substrate-binding protein
MDEDFLAGFSLALSQAARSGADIRVEQARASASFGSASQRRAAQSLLKDQGVDLVIALGAPRTAAVLGPVFADADRCLILADGGANLVRPSDQGSHVFFNTLGHWQSSFALGAWAARSFRGPGFLVCSGFEGGLDAPAAFRRGLDGSGGSEAGFAIPSAPLRESPLGWSPHRTLEEIRAQSPSFAAAFLSGSEGLDFLRAYAGSGLSGSIPLLGSSTLLQDAAAVDGLAGAAGLVGIAGWHRGLELPENRAFLAAFQKETGREAGALAVLGFDTGRMLLASLPGRGGHLRSSREALETASWTGPRGAVAMDPLTHAAVPELHLVGPAGRERIPTPGLGDAEVASLRELAAPAVLNPYPFF